MDHTLTKKIVEAMDGRIWVYNNKDGVGSTFMFSLPRLYTTENKTAN